jgi:hydrogenase expression/formation protein HypE
MNIERPEGAGPGFGCPIPIAQYPQILLAHGGGGKLTHQLIERMFLPSFRNPALEARHDGAVVEADGVRMALTTDSYVVQPLFFPGGDIGSLAVHGTVNDLAMCGARPRYLSAGFILEEGLSMETLWRVVESMRGAAAEADISIVTGDTKVVDRGKADGMYISTAGIGVVPRGRAVGPDRVRPGDAVILSGDIGRHGIAIMAAREGLAFECTLETDCAPLTRSVERLFAEEVEVHCMRDLTRGGLASALVEIAGTARFQIRVDEDRIAIPEEVRGACEILGFDPMFVANEGRFICFVPQEAAERAVAALRSVPVSSGAEVIGTVESNPSGRAVLRSRIGASRIIEMLSGEQLPRIC